MGSWSVQGEDPNRYAIARAPPSFFTCVTTWLSRCSDSPSWTCRNSLPSGRMLLSNCPQSWQTSPKIWIYSNTHSNTVCHSFPPRSDPKLHRAFVFVTPQTSALPKPKQVHIFNTSFTKNDPSCAPEDKVNPESKIWGGDLSQWLQQVTQNITTLWGPRRP